MSQNPRIDTPEAYQPLYDDYYAQRIGSVSEFTEISTPLTPA